MYLQGSHVVVRGGGFTLVTILLQTFTSFESFTVGRWGLKGENSYPHFLTVNDS
jgi:hypothetical protein